jgi:acetolactate synthase-1/2/3 large subunit
MRINGAGAIIECLAERGVDTVFGYPGGSVLAIYDALYERSDRVRHILAAHEQGAAHAADGYARSTGRTGVVFATSGPGATNLVTGIATAYMDSVPMVAITGNVSVSLLGKDSFQEVDILGVTMPITKHNFQVRDVTELVATIREAFDIAESGRPGPVLVDVPKDVSMASLEWEPAPTNMAPGSNTPARRREEPSEAEISAAVRMIAESRFPLLYAGGGAVAADAAVELRALAERIKAPVALSLMGLGLLPTGHPLLTGMIGMHGTRASNQAASKADLLVAIGARFSDRVISDPSRFARGARILHLDIDPAEIDKNIKADLALVGDLKSSLEKLARLAPLRVSSGWEGDLQTWRSEGPRDQQHRSGVSPVVLMHAIHDRVGDDAIVTTEVGQHQMWTAQYYPFSRPRQFITSGGLGTMGFGTGAAIGAQLGNPGRRVVHIAGDGSFRMNFAELGTMVYHDLPILVVVVNNGTLGMVRQWQTMFFGQRYSATTLDRPPDFVKLAGAFGIPGWRVENEEELGVALDKALASGGPALVDCRVDIDEHVFPMVPSGRPIHEQILGRPGD